MCYEACKGDRVALLARWCVGRTILVPPLLSDQFRHAVQDVVSTRPRATDQRRVSPSGSHLSEGTGWPPDPREIANVSNRCQGRIGRLDEHGWADGHREEDV